tara:strand:+ start:115086 stop:115481 length:396 start_codon:yes stop_codon:yes gene_type:complete
MLFSLPTMALEECNVGTIEFTNKQKKIQKKMSFCFDQDKRDKYIYSKNCKGLKCKPLLLPEKRPVDISKYKFSVGSPGFKVCRELKGSPQIIKYQLGKDKKWNQSARCIFDDETFVSTNLLFKIWKGLIIK